MVQTSGFGVNDGSIAITVQGGTPTNTYLWTATNGGMVPSGQENQEDLTGLVAGDYQVSITDGNSCPFSMQWTLTAPPELLISEELTAHQNALCFGQNTGAIQINIDQSSLPNYSYSLMDTTTGTLIQQAVNQTSSSHTFSNLLAGNYTAIVTDANGIDKTVTGIVISQPNDLVISSTVLSDYNGFQTSAFGVNDGSIAITVQGGTPTNTYLWTATNGGMVPSGQENQEDLTGLVAGDYQVSITDGNSCPFSMQWTLTAPPELLISEELTAHQNVLCFGQNTGVIQINIDQSSVPDYSYSLTETTTGAVIQALNQTSLSYTFTNLLAGNYNAIVTDANGIDKTVTGIVISQPNDLVISSTVLSDYNGFQTSAFGVNDGSIAITVQGGTPTNTYLWTATNGGMVPSGQENQEDLTGLVAGDYQLSITDGNSCPVSMQWTLTAPPELLISEELTAHQNALCFGQNTGIIQINIDQSSAPNYSYSLIDTTTGTLLQQALNQTGLSYTFTNLLVGNYDVIVADANGVSKTVAGIVISQPNDLAISNTVLSDYNGFQTSAFGVNDGSIAITVQGGTPTNTYLWTATNGGMVPSGQENQEDLTGLVAGDYQVSITDGNSCPFSMQWTLTAPPELLISEELTAHQNVLCFGQNTGVIQININQSSVPDYSYSLMNPATGAVIQQALNQTSLSYTFTNLLAGNYTAIVTDANRNPKTVTGIVISQPNDLVISNTVLSDYNGLQISSSGLNDGSIANTIQGGTAPYTYLWTATNGGFVPSGQENQEDLTGLVAGVYQLSITDANSCPFSMQWTLTEPPELLISEELNAHQNVLCFGQNTGVIQINIDQSSIPNYSYSLIDTTTGTVIKQALNQTSLSYTFTNLLAGNYNAMVTDANGLTKTVAGIVLSLPTNALIISKTIITDAIDCIDQNSGAIDLTISGGTPPYSYRWNNGAITQDITNIAPGDYTVEIEDANSLTSCSITMSFKIYRAPPIVITFEETTAINCTLKTVTQQTVAKVTGGILPYTYTWSAGSITGADNQIMTTTNSGGYSLTIKDANNCEIIEFLSVDLPTFDFADFSYTSLGLTNYNLLSIKDPIQFTNLSTGTYTSIQWNFGDGSPILFEENPSYTYDREGSYTVELLVEYATGCIETREETINITKGYSLISPTGFSPNGDRFNETIRPRYLGFIEIEMSIYDSWGTLLYYESDLDLKGWDGNLKKGSAQNGYYIMIVKGKTFYNEEIIESTPIKLLK